MPTRKATIVRALPVALRSQTKTCSPPSIATISPSRKVPSKDFWIALWPMLMFGWWKLSGRTSARGSLVFWGFFKIILGTEPLSSRSCAISCYGHSQTDVIKMCPFVESQEPSLFCQITPHLCFWPIRASKVHKILKGEEKIFSERSWSFPNCSKVEDSTSCTENTWNLE